MQTKPLISRHLCWMASSFVFMTAAGLAPQAQAQVPDAQVGAASAGRVEKQQINLPDTATSVSPQVEVKEAQIQNAPAGSENIKFQLQQLNIEGSSVYSDQELATIYKNKVGQTVSLAEVYGFAGDLTRKYRNDGYILTQVVVPPQTIEGGTAKLQVVEGYVGNVTVQDSSDPEATALIRQYADRVKSQGGALNVRDLERWMLLINDLPGVNARGVLSPSATTPGAADLTVISDRQLMNGMVGLDNYGSRYLGPTQLTVAGSTNSILGLNEKITAQAVTTPMGGFDPELAYFGLNYAQPIFNYGTVFEVFGSKTLTDPGYNLEEFDVKGNSELLGLTVRHPFMRSRNFNLTGRATFDYRNVETKNNIEPTRNDHIREARVGGRLEVLDTIFGAAYNTIDIEAAHGLDVFGSSRDDAINLSRADADNDFFKINAEFQRLQRLTSTINLFGSVAGQKASNALYSSEEFGVGGITYGRGYEPSEIIGDDGFAAKVELQVNTPVAISYLESYQIFGFYDFGKVWNIDPTSSLDKSNSLASTGVGFRTDLPAQINAGVLLAVPLTRDVSTEQDKSPSVLFTVSKRF